MTKVLMVAHTPPFMTHGEKLEAASYRSWQFLDPILDAGHEVCFCDIRSFSDTKTKSALKNTFQYRVIDIRHAGWLSKLQKAHDEFQPDCIVAVNFDAGLHAVRLKSKKPFWVDIYGDYLTIIQGFTYRLQSNRGIATSILFMARVLRAADRFSGCSQAQKHMLVGELGMAGRLNQYTYAENLVEVIPAGAPHYQTMPEKRKTRPLLSGQGIKKNDFVVLWCGGYNAWTDVHTLFLSLENAMAANAAVQFVSVGANTYDARDNVYQQFCHLVEQSANKDRYHFLGWRPWNEVFDYYWESDIGINIDAMHYETVYGTRTRLLEMMASGLPVITSLGTELSYDLQKNGAALTFEIGDADGFTTQIINAAENPALYRQLCESTQFAIENRFSFLVTTRSLTDWLKNPQKAGDHRQHSFFQWVKELSFIGRALVRQILWGFFAREN